MARHNFQPKCVAVADYIAHVKSGKYDINPVFQRDGHKPTKWKQDVIIHHYKFGSVPTIYYHQNEKNNCNENLDGKQKTLAFMDYIDNKFTIPQKHGIDPELCCRYSELSPANKRRFDDSCVILSITNTQLTPEEIELFFTNVQKSSDTSPGEKLNANLLGYVKNYVLKRIPDDKHIFDAINLHKNDKRKKLLATIMRYMYLKSIVGGLLRRYEPHVTGVNDWSQSCSEDDNDFLDEGYNAVIRTALFLSDHKIKRAHNKCVFGAFFRFLHLESSEKIEKVVEKIKTLEDGDVFAEFTTVNGDTHTTSYERYKYLVNEFIQ
jgi:hypothetical protein